MKKALLVVSTFSAQRYSGANARLVTITKILENSGYQITQVTNQDLRKIKSEPSYYDLGVVVSFANLHSIRRIKKFCKFIWLDSTDSIFHTRLLGLGRTKLTSYMKGLVEIASALIWRKNISLVTYISDLERAWDKPLFSTSKSFIIPNLANKLESPSKHPREIFFVGDTNYNANRKAIKYILRNVNQIKSKNNLDIFIVTGAQSLRKEAPILHNEVKLHYVHALPMKRMYHQNAIHIVPIWNRVGIKNKVSEPASLGVAVLGANSAFNGLRIFPHMVTIKKRSDFFKSLNNILSQDSKNSLQSFDVILKDETIELISHLGMIN
jgi:hypothetical protein